MTRSRKPSRAQLRLIAAILERGAADVAGPELFNARRGIQAASSTLASCQERGWVTREERNGVAYWTVTLDGRADAERADEASIDRALWRGRLRMAPIIRGR